MASVPSPAPPLPLRTPGQAAAYAKQHCVEALLQALAQQFLLRQPPEPLVFLAELGTAMARCADKLVDHKYGDLIKHHCLSSLSTGALPTHSALHVVKEAHLLPTSEIRAANKAAPAHVGDITPTTDGDLTPSPSRDKVLRSPPRDSVKANLTALKEDSMSLTATGTVGDPVEVKSPLSGNSVSAPSSSRPRKSLLVWLNQDPDVATSSHAIPELPGSEETPKAAADDSRGRRFSKARRSMTRDGSPHDNSALTKPQNVMERLVDRFQGEPEAVLKMKRFNLSDLLGNGQCRKVILEEGTGRCPARGDTCEVYYTAYLADKGGKVFAAAPESGGEPYRFVFGDMKEGSPGWHIGVASMREGERAALTVQWQLGYGPKAVTTLVGGVEKEIPPMCTLRYEVLLQRVIPVDNGN